MDDWLRAFGIRVTALPPEGAVRFTNMFVPEPAWRLGAWIAAEMRDIHLHVRRGLEVPQAPQTKVLWLSRSGLSYDRRSYDEVMLEWLLDEYVHSIRPERMSLAEQISMIESSDALVGIVGSAFHTLLMAERMPRCVYLCSGQLRDAHMAQDILLGTDATFLQALAQAAPRGRKSFPRGHRVLIPEVLRALGGSLLPQVFEDAWLRMLACPERLSSRTAKSPVGRSLGKAVARVVLDPLSMSARMWLGAAFAAEGLEHCALEQYRTVMELSAEYPDRAPLYGARMLARLGQVVDAGAMAGRALAVNPDSKEAKEYVDAAAAFSVR